MSKKIFLFFGVFIFFVSVSAQQTGKKYFFQQVSWSLTLHPDFIPLDSVADQALKEKGVKAISDANDIDMGESKTISLISAGKGEHNYFNCNITPYDLKKDGDYEASGKNVKNIVYKTFKDQIPDGKIDTATTKIFIDGLEFDKFQVIVSINDKELLHMLVLSKYYKGYDFGITYLYLDPVTKEQIEKMLNESKFTK
jgi:hypothetical protein